MINDYILLIFSWILYFFAHSALATTKVKEWFAFNKRVYRLVYSVISVFGLLLIVVWIFQMPTQYLRENDIFIEIFSLLLFICGCILGYLSFRPYSFSSFIGLRNERKPTVLNRTGLYAYMRHPLYTSLILILVSLAIFFPTKTVLISVGANLIYLPLGIYFEEKKLVDLFGSAYEEYQKEVPSILPKMNYSSSS